MAETRRSVQEYLDTLDDGLMLPSRFSNQKADIGCRYRSDLISDFTPPEHAPS